MAGRNPLAFASLSAGVTPQAFNRGTQFGAAGSSRSQYVTVEGGRDSSTNYAIDGVYVRSLRFNNLSLNPPLDAVQEVAILRNSFTTEYGQGQAVVSMVTKSGSNSIYRLRLHVQARRLRSTPPTIFGQKPGDKTQAGFTARRPGRSRTSSLPSADTRGLRTTADRTLLGSVPSPALLYGDFSGLSYRHQGSAHGSAVSRQHHSVGSFLELRQDTESDGPRAERCRGEQLQGDQGVQRRRGHGGRSSRSGDQQAAHALRAIPVLQGQSAEPVALQLYEFPADRAQLGDRRDVGRVAVDRQRDALRLQLRVPSERADQPGRPQLGRRHRPSATSPEAPIRSTTGVRVSP